MLDRAQLIELARELIDTDYDLEVVVRSFDWGGHLYQDSLESIRNQLRIELRVYQHESGGDWRQAPRKRVAVA